MDKLKNFSLFVALVVANVLQGAADQTNDRDRRLVIGVLGNNVQMIDQALNDGANPNQGVVIPGRGFIKPLILAVARADIPMAAYLIQRGASVNVQDAMGLTPLMLAAHEGEILLVDLLIAHGGNVNIQDSLGMTALMHAAKKGQADIVGLLLDAGADPDITDVDGMKATDFALEEGHFVILNLLSPSQPSAAEAA